MQFLETEAEDLTWIVCCCCGIVAVPRIPSHTYNLEMQMRTHRLPILMPKELILYNTRRFVPPHGVLFFLTFDICSLPVLWKELRGSLSSQEIIEVSRNTTQIVFPPYVTSSPSFCSSSTSWLLNFPFEITKINNCTLSILILNELNQD